MKICVIMCDSRSFQWNVYTGVCLSANYLYSQHYNYDLKVFTLPTKFNEHEAKVGCYSLIKKTPRFVSWCKILCAYYTLKSNKYDYVVYLDSDAFLTPQNSIETILQNNKEAEIYFISNHPLRFDYIGKSKYCDPEVTIKSSSIKGFCDVPCSGFFIIKNTENSLKFLKDWFLQEPETHTNPNIRPWDQAGLWDLFIQKKYNIHVLQNEGFTVDSTISNKAIIHCHDKGLLTLNLVNTFYNSLTHKSIRELLTKINYEEFHTDLESIKTLLEYKEG